MDNDVKPETIPPYIPRDDTVTLIDLCSSDDSDVEEHRRYNSVNHVGAKRGRDTSSALDRENVKRGTVENELAVVLPPGGFDQSVPPVNMTHTFPADPCNAFSHMPAEGVSSGRVGSCKQFWKAGDYEGAPGGNWDLSSGGFDHVRVHPKFLHSNATSHKWALGGSIGLLSYTFLRSTGKEDIVVPMLDYGKRDLEWSKIVRSSLSDWDKNVKTIIQWSPFSSEEDLLRQFGLMKDRGTRIIIYNLWEDDHGLLELDFDADPHDIQLRGVNRDEKNIKMAAQFPNSRHFLTFKHSLRSYVSILYLRIPPAFRIILRGKDVEHHNVVNDMMQTEQITYRPQYGADTYVKDSNMSAVVVLGFVKDAKHHVDVQGFNVYHKNRLIKPFWRIWNAAGSDGRGVIGVLEANFVEPAHDKQGFERTTVLSRLETRLVQMQKIYWSTNCHKIGYAPRRYKPVNGYSHRDTSPENDPEGSAPPGIKTRASDKFYSSSYPSHHKGDNGVPGKDSSLVKHSPTKILKELSVALEDEVNIAREKIEEMSKEQENLIEIFTEERDRRDGEEENLRKKLEETSNTIEELLNKIRKLEASKGSSWRR
ncbi:hypothetical protein DY000_02027273 [Brassica cretica]|uniref:Morc S5 domain-containing protein n=1 Tax=Brassica cretica TaxID=69181 RepID=A0ABQ7E3U2_BRACR|nr:hypothetical protein DY000_02027273 [Brassica cretica]